MDLPPQQRVALMRSISIAPFLSLPVVGRAEPAGRRAQMQMPPAEPAERAEPPALSPPQAVECAKRVKRAQLSLPVVERAEAVLLRAP